MALTVNQKKILLELVTSKIEDGMQFETVIVALAEASDAQVLNQIKNFAAQRRDEETARIAAFDASVRPAYVAQQTFYAAEAE